MSRDVRSFVIPSALEALAGCTGPGIQAVALSLLRTVEGEELGRAEDLISCFSLIRIVMYELLGEGSSYTFICILGRFNSPPAETG